MPICGVLISPSTVQSGKIQIGIQKSRSIHSSLWFAWNRMKRQKVYENKLQQVIRLPKPEM